MRYIKQQEGDHYTRSWFAILPVVIGNEVRQWEKVSVLCELRYHPNECVLSETRLAFVEDSKHGEKIYQEILQNRKDMWEKIMRYLKIK